MHRRMGISCTQTYIYSHHRKCVPKPSLSRKPQICLPTMKVGRRWEGAESGHDGCSSGAYSSQGFQTRSKRSSGREGSRRRKRPRSQQSGKERCWLLCCVLIQGSVCLRQPLLVLPLTHCLPYLAYKEGARKTTNQRASQPTPLPPLISCLALSLASAHAVTCTCLKPLPFA